MIPTHKVTTKRIDCENVVLLPYNAALVPVYHAWMADPELLELTESEPLSLEQEYANQVSWANDPSKYCFIVHSRRPVDTSFRLPGGKGVQTGLGVDYTLESEAQAEEMKKPVDVKWVEENEEDTEEGAEGQAPAASGDSAAADSTTAAESTTATAAPAAAEAAPAASGTTAAADSASAAATDSTASAAAAETEGTAATTAAAASFPDPGSRWPLTPIGDVNVFLHEDFNLGDYGISGGGCELEVMLARREYRGRGLATEAVKAIMRFSERRLGVSRFVAKVLAKNAASVSLFERRLGFRLVEYVEAFDERVYFKDTSLEGGDDDEEEDDEEDEEESQSEGQDWQQQRQERTAAAVADGAAAEDVAKADAAADANAAAADGAEGAKSEVNNS